MGFVFGKPFIYYRILCSLQLQIIKRFKLLNLNIKVECILQLK